MTRRPPVDDAPFPPTDLGFKHPSWRRDQWRMTSSILSSPKRYTIREAPPGSGKSVVAMSIAQLLMDDQRVAILVPLKSLQDQYAQEFEGQAFVMKGMSEHSCALKPFLTVEEGPCHLGFKCELRDGGCSYYDAKREAQTTRILITNVAYFWYANKFGGGLGKWHTIIVDEAHLLEGWLMQLVSVRVTLPQLEQVLGLDADIGLPASEKVEDWAAWAKETLKLARQELAGWAGRVKEATQGGTNDDIPRETAKGLKKAETLVDALLRISVMKPESWVVEPIIAADARHRRRHGAEISPGSLVGADLKPIWVGEFAQDIYTLAESKVVFMSGTMPDGKMYAHLLGVPDGQWDYASYPCRWPVENRPVIYVPTAKMRYQVTSEELDTLAARIDQVIGRRLDRKGVVHSVSYWLQEAILARTQHRSLFYVHERGNGDGPLEEFKAADPPAVLISPRAGIGLDLMGNLARYQILPKVPFPTTQTNQLKAREAQDPDYAAYVAATTLIQQSFRAIRSETDWSETIVLDDTWRWFRRQYNRFFPWWFQQAWREYATLPDPLEPR